MDLTFVAATLLSSLENPTTNMDRNAAQEKGFVESEHLEVVQDNAATLQPTHYRPQSDAEKKLDKGVNLKLDLIVVTLLAVEFIVRYLLIPDVCMSSFLTNTVLRHRQNQRRLCRYELVRERR